MPCKEGNLMPKIIIFDLDETLFEADFDQPSVLSKSAKKSLSTSAKGISTNAEHQIREIKDITAIERIRMKEIFDDAFNIIKNAKMSGIESPIAIKIITSGNYDADEVKCLLDKFYADNDSIFSNNDFPIEVFNNGDYDTYLHHEFCQLLEGSINNERAKKFFNDSGEMMDLCKAKVINENFMRWKETMPNLEKKDVTLVDNANYNIKGVEYAGYHTLHYPTTNTDREPHQRFSQEKEHVFCELKKILEISRQEIYEAVNVQRQQTEQLKKLALQLEHELQTQQLQSAQVLIQKLMIPTASRVPHHHEHLLKQNPLNKNAKDPSKQKPIYFARSDTPANRKRNTYK